MKPIDPEDQKYYDEYFTLFATEGWKRFVKDLTDSLISDQETAVARCDTSEKWHTERGAQGKALRIINLENSLRAAHENLTNPPEVDDPSLED